MFSEKQYFKQWLVGFIDGDGSFVVHKGDLEYPLTRKFTFKMSLFVPNSQVLQFIQKELGVGVISKPYKNMVTFYVSNRKDLINIILPIFDEFPLLTVKQHRYERFRRCLMIYDDPSISMVEKDKRVTAIWGEKLPVNYRSHVWKYYLNNEEFGAKNLKGKTRYHNDPHLIISKPWLSGFMEADGSFFLQNVSKNSLIHVFNITQKEDPHLLEAIRKMFGIKAKVLLHKKNYHSLDTAASETIEEIIEYFTAPDNSYRRTMKGLKSIEFDIWARSYKKYKGDFKKLQKIQKFVRKLRTRIYQIKTESTST